MIYPWAVCRHKWREKERHTVEIVRVDGWTKKKFGTDVVGIIVLECEKCGDLKNHAVRP